MGISDCVIKIINNNKTFNKLASLLSIFDQITCTLWATSYWCIDSSIFEKWEKKTVKFKWILSRKENCINGTACWHPNWSDLFDGLAVCNSNSFLCATYWFIVGSFTGVFYLNSGSSFISHFFFQAMHIFTQTGAHNKIERKRQTDRPTDRRIPMQIHSKYALHLYCSYKMNYAAACVRYVECRGLLVLQIYP